MVQAQFSCASIHPGAELSRQQVKAHSKAEKRTAPPQSCAVNVSSTPDQQIRCSSSTPPPGCHTQSCQGSKHLPGPGSQMQSAPSRPGPPRTGRNQTVAVGTLAFVMLAGVVALSHIFHIIPSIDDGSPGVQDLLAGETRFGILHTNTQPRTPTQDGQNPAGSQAEHGTQLQSQNTQHAASPPPPPPTPSPLPPPPQQAASPPPPSPQPPSPSPSPPPPQPPGTPPPAKQVQLGAQPVSNQAVQQPQGGQQQQKQGSSNNGSLVTASQSSLQGGTANPCPPLSTALLEKYARNKTVLITFVGLEMFRIFGRTWLGNIRASNISYAVVAVPDARTAVHVAHAGVPCFTVDKVDIGDVHAGFKWGSSHWKAHTWQKVLVVRSVAHLGFNIVHSDIDVVWFRDPYEYFMNKYTEPDYFVSMDPITTANPIGDDGPEAGISVGHYMNTGVYFLRATPGGRALIDKWVELKQHYQTQFHDQDGLYQYLSRLENVQYDRARRTALVVEGQTKLAQMPATQFQNAYSHSINQIHKLHKLQPYEVHMVWTYGNNYGKAHRMREHMYFIDPPDYYNQGRYLSVDLTPINTPRGFDRWNDTYAMAKFHWEAMEQQLSEFYYALALAYTSGRILILPKMACHCIHNWFESPQCRLPGETITHFPMTCPADYVFDMATLYNMRLDMRNILIREHSFLENPRTAAKYKEKPYIVKAGNVSHPQHNEKGRLNILPTKFKDLELQSELDRLHLEPRIHIPNPKQLFDRFTFPTYQEELEKLVKKLPLKWCCLPEKVWKAVRPAEGEAYQLTIKP